MCAAKLVLGFFCLIALVQYVLLIGWGMSWSSLCLAEASGLVVMLMQVDLFVEVVTQK